MASESDNRVPAKPPRSEGEGVDDLFFEDEAPAPAAPPSADNTRPLSPPPAMRMQSGFAFTPVWDAYHKILSTYVCTPVRPLPSGMMGFGHELLGRGARDVERAEFDRTTFNFTVETANTFQHNNVAVLLSFLIDYGSLSSTKSRDILLSAFRTLPKSLSAAISVRITNAPEDAANTTLAERIALLRTYFRAITFQIHLDQDMSRFAYMGLHGLVFRLEDGQNWKTLDWHQIAMAIRQAKAAKLQFAFDGVPSLGCAKSLVEAGATYLSGPFLGMPLDKPATMRRCTFEDFSR